MKLAIFDVDGTLLRGDTACQVIARHLGTYDRMCEMERASALTSREEVIAYREEMAGWYMEAGLDSVVSALADLPWAPGAHEGIERLRISGFEVALASITWSFAVDQIASQLGVTRWAATGLDFGTGVIDHAWGETKRDFLLERAKELAITNEETAAVGDSSGDFEMLDAADLGIYVGAEPPDIQGVVHMPCADILSVAARILDS